MKLLLLGLLPLIALAAAPGARADRLDAYIRAQMKKQHIPGLSLAVVRSGRLVKAAGYGLANVEWKIPATPDTVYQIQSVTKQFTATAVMMLVEEGRLGLDDPVSKYLDGTPAAWKEITLRHLLTHTSGIKDFINEPTASLRLDVTEEEVLQATAPRPLNFAPGERWAYSNTNYHLLAMILRKVTGKSWGDFVQERICAPLGMKDTRVLSLSEIIPRRAAGYLWRDGALHNGEYVAASILGYAGGGLRSTVRDMAKWDAALYTDRLLKPATLEQMWTPMKLNSGAETGYGFGWGVSRVQGRRVLSHTGGHFTGFTTVITRYPDDRLTVIVLTNQSGASNPSAIAQGVAGLYVPALLPPVRKAIRDTEPEVTARLREIMAAAREGRSDPGLFTPEMRAVLSPERVRQAAAMLKALGDLQKLELLERREENNNRSYQYRAVFAEGTLQVYCTWNREGKIAGLMLEAE